MIYDYNFNFQHILKNNMQTKKKLKKFLCSRNLFKAAKPLGQDPIELGAQHGDSQDDTGD